MKGAQSEEGFFLYQESTIDIRNLFSKRVLAKRQQNWKKQ